MTLFRVLIFPNLSFSSRPFEIIQSILVNRLDCSAYTIESEIAIHLTQFYAEIEDRNLVQWYSTFSWHAESFETCIRKS